MHDVNRKYPNFPLSTWNPCANCLSLISFILDGRVGTSAALLGRWCTPSHNHWQSSASRPNGCNEVRSLESPLSPMNLNGIQQGIYGFIRIFPCHCISSRRVILALACTSVDAKTFNYFKPRSRYTRRKGSKSFSMSSFFFSAKDFRMWNREKPIKTGG